ncbi:MAG TPA: tetratricopeptide repeat protein [Rhodanobacteraceae bacterium]
MKRRAFALPIPFALTAVLLVACTQPAPRAAQPPSAARLVASIQAAGAKADSSLHVAPLRDPAVTRLLQRAHYQESLGKFARAAATVDDALKVTPDSPALLQDRAELAIRLGQYAQAEQLARRSYALGPKTGGLCARNWQTVAEMRRIAGDAAGAKAAHQALAHCVPKAG